MKFSPLNFLLLGLIAVVFSGCFELDRVVLVKPDGSGTIEERYLLNKDAITKPQPDRAALHPDDLAAATTVTPPDAATVAKTLPKYGKGVALASWKRLETKDSVGYEAVFTFPDVTLLRADTVLANQVPSMIEEKDDDGTRFTFVKGKIVQLSIPLPPAEKTAKQKISQSTTNNDLKAKLAVFKFLSELHTRVVIKPVGAIVDTNAHFVKDGVVTIEDTNFKGMLKDPKYSGKFKHVMDELAAGRNPPDDKDNTEDPEYMKQETSNPIVIHFK